MQPEAATHDDTRIEMPPPAPPRLSLFTWIRRKKTPGLRRRSLKGDYEGTGIRAGLGVTEIERERLQIGMTRGSIP